MTSTIGISQSSVASATVNGLTVHCPLYGVDTKPLRNDPPSFFKQEDGPRIAEKWVCHAKFTQNLPEVEATLTDGKEVYLLNSAHGIQGGNNLTEWRSFWEASPGYSVCIAIAGGPYAQIPIGSFTPIYHYFPIMYGFYVFDEELQKWRASEGRVLWTDSGKLANDSYPILHKLDNGIKWNFRSVDVAWAASILSAEISDILDSDVSLFPKGYGFTPKYIRSYAFPQYDLNPESAFLFGESSWFRDITEIGPPTFHSLTDAGVQLGILKQGAVYSAFETMPKLSDNSISNAIEIITFLADFRDNLYIKALSSAKKEFQNAWLSYRYVYGTTVMDANEAISYFERKWNLAEYSRFPLYGTSHLSAQGADVTCRVKFYVENKRFSALKDGWAFLKQLGLQPNLYVAWDMTPFSFVVDWFLPVGSILSTLDAQQYLDKQDYQVSQPLYSLTYKRNDMDGVPKCYTRWKGTMPEFLIGAAFQTTHVSGKTRYKRLADAYSLFC